MTTRRNLYALAALLSFLASPGLAAVEVKATRVARGPKIDGLLSDAVWSEAVPFTAFRMAEPQPNQEPSEKTEIRILFDDANLYIGVLCLDSEPGRISANSLAHDGGASTVMGYGSYGHMPQSSSDDVIRVLLDPFQNKRTAYIFSVNPRGAPSEGAVLA